MQSLPDLSGKVLGGRYLLGELLGKGGWGAVYAATQTDLGRAVAIKVLHADHEHSSDGLARFSREAHAAAALGHPNIALVTDFQANTGEPPFLVMERLVGGTLGAEIRRLGRLPPARVVWIAHQILAALGEAHSKGIVHRDVKPDNVFLVSAPGVEDFVKLLDFGIAKLSDTTAPQLTSTETSLGSPAYMAPEQIRHGQLEPRTDVYAVGATMFHAIAGRIPFDAPNIHALLLAITEQRATPLSLVDPSIDPALSAIVDRAMSKDPAARYGSAAEMRAALEPFLGQQSARIGAPPSAYGPPPTAAPATETSGAKLKGTSVGIGAMPVMMPSGPPMPNGPPPGTPPPMMPSGPPMMMSAPPMMAPPPMMMGQPVPAISAPPPANTFPSYGTPPLPPVPPPVHVAPAPSKGSGAIIGLLVVVVLLLLGVVGGGIAAVLYLRPTGEIASTAPVASNAATVPATAAPTAVASNGAIASSTAKPSGKPGAAPFPNGPAPNAPTASLDAGPSPPAAPDAGPPVGKKQMGGTKPYMSGGEFPKYDLAKARASIGAVMPAITQCFVATEYDPPDHQFPYYLVNIDPTGNVTGVSPVTDASNHPKLNPCVFAALRRAKFEAVPGGGQIKVGFTARNRDNP